MDISFKRISLIFLFMSIFISDVIAHGISGDGWTLDEPHSTFTDSISTPNFGYDIN